MIFETKRLVVRKLKISDLPFFHVMQCNPKVMQYVDGEVKSILEHEIELAALMKKYTKPNNDFWVYAIEEKKNQQFIGTVALVKDNQDDEIGYRFLESYWGLGYGSEVCKGLISYAKKLGVKKLVGYVVNENVASIKILERLGFVKVKSFLNTDNQQEYKYETLL